MMKIVLLLTLAVYLASAERISNLDSPSWERRTTLGPYSRDRLGSGSYAEAVRGAGSSDLGTGSRSGSPSGVTDRWGEPVTYAPGTYGAGRVTYSWEKDSATTRGRSSYLDGFTTQASPYDRERDRYDYSSRRPSYQTDKWGDALGGATTHSSYVTWSSGRDRESVRDRDVTDKWGSGSGSSWDRTTSRYGTTRSWLSGSDYGSGSLSGRDRFDRDNAYVRIEVELVKFTNEKGITIDGNKCDTFGQCDPVVYGFIDTERPNAEFPGSRDAKFWPVIFQSDNANTFDFKNSNISRDVCGSPYRDSTLRVLIEDADGMTKNDIVNKFDCPISREPDSSETMATWHSSICTPKQQAAQMKLTFRYKVYVVPRHRCDPNSGVLSQGSSTTKKRT